MVFLLFKFLMKLLFANSGELDQTPRFAASDLVLHGLPMPHKKDAMLMWVNLKDLGQSPIQSAQILKVCG